MSDREQVRRDAEIPSRDECLAWMERYASTPWNGLALATAAAHDLSPLKVMSGLRAALIETEQKGRVFLKAYIDASVSDEEGLLASVDQAEWRSLWVAVDDAAQSFGAVLSEEDSGG